MTTAHGSCYSSQDWVSLHKSAVFRITSSSAVKRRHFFLAVGFTEGTVHGIAQLTVPFSLNHRTIILALARNTIVSALEPGSTQLQTGKLLTLSWRACWRQKLGTDWKPNKRSLAVVPLPGCTTPHRPTSTGPGAHLQPRTDQPCSAHTLTEKFSLPRLYAPG